MNILVLNGSPRPDGNTSALVKGFEEGALSKGHQVNVINVGKLRLNGCVACEYCHEKGNGKCIVKDDMQQIYEGLDKADMVVFASPVYYWGFSGQLQAAITRIYAPNVPKARKYALMLSSQSDGVYDGIISQYRSMLGYFSGKDEGIITAYGDENKSPAKIKEAYTLGAGL